MGPEKFNPQNQFETTANGGVSTEFSGKVITPDLLEDDNNSFEARENRRKWQENKAKGIMHAVIGCSDARNVLTLPEQSYGLLSIAASGNIEPYQQVLKFEGVRDVVVVSHYDGELVVPEESLEGCGGHGEKVKMIKNGAPEKAEGVTRFVNERVKHPDPIVSSALRAQEITLRTNKPTAAAVQDHRTGKLDLVAIFWRRNGILLTALNDNLEMQDFNPQNFDPKKLYANGIPGINPDALPDYFHMFREYAYANQEMVTDLRRKYPDISDRLKVQNPHTLAITTLPDPLKNRYPATFDEPGSYFKLAIPRYKDRENNIREIRPEDLAETLDQTEYPISHAVKNHHDKTKPFSKVGTLFIETSDINLSKKIADAAMERPWMNDWLDFPEHHIIAAEVRGGTATEFLEVT